MFCERFFIKFINKGSSVETVTALVFNTLPDWIQSVWKHVVLLNAHTLHMLWECQHTYRFWEGTVRQISMRGWTLRLSSGLIWFNWIEEDICGEQKSLVKIPLITATIIWARRWKNPEAPSIWEWILEVLRVGRRDTLTDWSIMRNGSTNNVKFAGRWLCFVNYSNMNYGNSRLEGTLFL